jgi:hypothetical protein
MGASDLSMSARAWKHTQLRNGCHDAFRHMEGRLFALTAKEVSDGRDIARCLGIKNNALQG